MVYIYIYMLLISLNLNAQRFNLHLSESLFWRPGKQHIKSSMEGKKLEQDDGDSYGVKASAHMVLLQIHYTVIDWVKIMCMDEVHHLSWICGYTRSCLSMTYFLKKAEYLMEACLIILRSFFCHVCI